MAALRFHRPPSGLGLNQLAQASLKSARLLLKEIDILKFKPDRYHNLLGGRGQDEAYLTVRGRDQYVLYLPRKAMARILIDGKFYLRWLEIATGDWSRKFAIEVDDSLRLQSPSEGHWIALIEAR